MSLFSSLGCCCLPRMWLSNTNDQERDLSKLLLLLLSNTLLLNGDRGESNAEGRCDSCLLLRPFIIPPNNNNQQLFGFPPTPTHRRTGFELWSTSGWVMMMCQRTTDRRDNRSKSADGMHRKAACVSTTPHVSSSNVNPWSHLFLPWPRVCRGPPLLKSCTHLHCAFRCTAPTFRLHRCSSRSHKP